MDDLPEQLEAMAPLNCEPYAIHLDFQGESPKEAGIRINAMLRLAAAEIRSLREQVERLSNDGIHTCHDQCPRLACVQRREIKSLREQVAQEKNKLADALNHETTDCEIEAALAAEGIRTWGRDGEGFDRMFAIVMKARADAIEAQKDKEPRA